MLTVNNYSGSNYSMAFSSKFSNLKRILEKNGLYKKGMNIEEMERLVSERGLNTKVNNTRKKFPSDTDNYVAKHKKTSNGFRIGKQK